ncbi:hypothetical protein [Mesobacillus harenae]|uniref:hypothetical protein n=1 Tax=Mesobacillus harenae TaxID=2213203 RepID=UPI0015804C7E|nr:hypothetical protein [Mesobacillus harenae]
MKGQTSLSAHREARLSIKNADRLQGIFIGFLAVSFILMKILPVPQIEWIVSLVIIAVIAWVLPGVRGSTLVISVFLLTTAIALMLYHRVPAQEWMDSLRINITLVAIIIFVPLLGIPVRTGGYVDALKVVLFQRMNEPNFFYIGTKLLTHTLGVVLNMGSVSIVHQLTAASNIKAPRLVANAINRGFVSSIFWSPYFSAMALILSQIPIRWSSIVFYSFGLSIISILVSIWLDQVHIKANMPDKTEASSSGTAEADLVWAKKKVAELFIFLFVITAAVLFLEFITSSSIVLMICIVSLFFPLVWCLVSGKGSAYLYELKQHLFVGIPRMKKEIVLFLIAGFFSGAFVHTDLSSALIEFIQNTFGAFHLGAAYFLSLIVVVTAVIGIHPIVVITIFVTSIKPELIGFSPEYFAILLLGSWGISNTVSPATAVNNLLANLLNVNIIDLSIRWNAKYAIIMLCILPVYLNLTGI